MNEKRTPRPPFLLLPMLVMLALSILAGMPGRNGYEVSDRVMKELFEQEQVKVVSIDGNLLRMELHEPYIAEEGESYERVYHELYDFQFFYDTLHELVEAQVAAGIIDPVKVTRTTLQNATSVAGTFLTTEAVVADKPEPEPPVNPAAAGGMGMM